MVLDTDCALGVPGAKVDDGFALALAFASPEIDVTFVTTVAGNVDVLTATARTTALFARLGRPDVPVVAGGCPDGGAAARALASRALERPGEVTVVALGPLTTVAAAIGADPRVAAAIGDVVAMGGRFLGGPDAEPEFNTRTDPWAARAVHAAGARTWCVSLDVTSRMALGPADLERLAAGGAAARYLAEQARARVQVLAAYHPPAGQLSAGHQSADHHSAVGVTPCPMHDPLAVLAVTHPHLLRWHAADVTVDTERPHRGRTRAHLLHDGAAHLATCRVAIDVDAEAAKEVLITRLAALP